MSCHVMSFSFNLRSSVMEDIEDILLEILLPKTILSKTNLLPNHNGKYIFLKKPSSAESNTYYKFSERI